MTNNKICLDKEANINFLRLQRLKIKRDIISILKMIISLNLELYKSIILI